MRLVLIAIALFLGFSSAFAEGQNCVKLSIGGYRCDDGVTISGTAAEQPAKKEFSKNRIDVNLGVSKSTGGGVEHSDYDFNPGANLGISYTRFFTESIGVGGFADGYLAETEEGGDIEVFSTLIGAQVVSQTPTKDGLSGYGALKIGYAPTTAEFVTSGGSKESDGGIGFIFEVGVRKKITQSVDLGVSGKYKWLEVDFGDIYGSGDRFKLDLSSFTLAFNLGVSF